MILKFMKGDQVEVCSKEEGFLGSYYEATILSKLPNKSSYKVKYQNLVTDEDESKPLIEIISANQLRPIPPKFLLFRFDEKVDALYNDGWWIGEIIGGTGFSNEFTVYFETTGEKIDFVRYELRKHLDLVNGDWVTSPTRQR